MTATLLLPIADHHAVDRLPEVALQLGHADADLHGLFDPPGSHDAHQEVVPMPVVLRGAIAALLLILLVPGSALAHERRDVGKLQFVVGFIGEPAIVGEPNGIDLRITDKASGQPVEGAEKTLKASVQYGGGQPRELALRARFGMKGAYTADLIPTRAGAYSFTFTGAVGDEPVDQKFESGPGRFNDVEDAAKLQFPAAVPYAR